MVQPHSWRECRPALVGGPGSPPLSESTSDALMLAWSFVSNRDREFFHGFTCLDQRDRETMAAIGRVSRLLEMALDVNPES